MFTCTAKSANGVFATGPHPGPPTTVNPTIAFTSSVEYGNVEVLALTIMVSPWICIPASGEELTAFRQNPSSGTAPIGVRDAVCACHASGF